LGKEFADMVGEIRHGSGWRRFTGSASVWVSLYRFPAGSFEGDELHGEKINEGMEKKY
jgi:hypothetical protein